MNPPWRQRRAGSRGRPSPQATVAALLDPRTYPDRTTHVDVIETHMAWVFLTDARAYKVKKPVRMELIDNRSLQARKQACDEELRLNRRLARDVYLRVAPLLAVGDALRVGSSPDEDNVVEWLVEMRRLPHDRMLDACIARAEVPDGELDRLLELLVPFYANAERSEMDGDSYHASLAKTLEDKRRWLQQPRYHLDQVLVRRVVEAQTRWMAAHQSLLQPRGRRVVDAHGDLRPEHVCLEHPVPAVIDCLEFYRPLRLLDPASELSFLGLECERLGASWVGGRLLAGYAERAADPVPPALASFYQTIHALTRAVVAVWHLDDEDCEDAERWQARATWYLESAAERL